MSALVATFADADEPLEADGIISLGFPRKGDPSLSNHLTATRAPLLFIQGTNDTLGSRAEIEQMVRLLGNRARVEWIEGATHKFDVEGSELSKTADLIAKRIRIQVDKV